MDRYKKQRENASRGYEIYKQLALWWKKEAGWNYKGNMRELRTLILLAELEILRLPNISLAMQIRINTTEKGITIKVSSQEN
jgi:hypothetical protein